MLFLELLPNILDLYTLREIANNVIKKTTNPIILYWAFIIYNKNRLLILPIPRCIIL
jgi:hypothetical protein